MAKCRLNYTIHWYFKRDCRMFGNSKPPIFRPGPAMEKNNLSVVLAVLANVMVAQRAPQTSINQPFGHTCFMKAMSTGQTRYIWRDISIRFSIHLIMTNGTSLTTVGQKCCIFQVLLQQKFSTLYLDGSPQHSQLFGAELGLHQDRSHLCFTKLLQHLLWFGNAIHFHDCIANLDFLPWVFIIPTINSLGTSNINNDKSSYLRMTTQNNAETFVILTSKFCLKDAVILTAWNQSWRDRSSSWCPSESR